MEGYPQVHHAARTEVESKLIYFKLCNFLKQILKLFLKQDPFYYYKYSTKFKKSHQPILKQKLSKNPITPRPGVSNSFL